MPSVENDDVTLLSSELKEMRFSCFLLCVVPTVWALGVAVAWILFGTFDDTTSSSSSDVLEDGATDDLLASLLYPPPTVKIISSPAAALLTYDEMKEVQGCTHYKCLDIYR